MCVRATRLLVTVLRKLKIVASARFVTKICLYLVVWSFMGMMMFYITYHLLIPRMRLSRKVYFDYAQTTVDEAGTPKIFPMAEVDLLGPDFSIETGVSELYPRRSPPLSATEIYEIHLKGTIPNTPRIRSLGAIMLKLRIFSCSGEKLADSARPVVLPYRSPFILFVREMFWLFLFMFGAKNDVLILDFTLLEGYIEPGGEYRSCRAEVTLSSSELLFAEATLEFQVQLTGILRNVIYWSWPISLLVGSLVGMACLFPCCLLCMGWPSLPRDQAIALVDTPPPNRQQTQVQGMAQEEVLIEDNPLLRDEIILKAKRPHEVAPRLHQHVVPSSAQVPQPRNLLDSPSDTEDVLVVSAMEETDEFTTPKSLTPSISNPVRCSPISAILSKGGIPLLTNSTKKVREPQLGGIAHWWQLQQKEQQTSNSPSQQHTLEEEDDETGLLHTSGKKDSEAGEVSKRHGALGLRRRRVNSNLANR